MTVCVRAVRRPRGGRLCCARAVTVLWLCCDRADRAVTVLCAGPAAAGFGVGGYGSGSDDEYVEGEGEDGGTFYETLDIKDDDEAALRAFMCGPSP